MPDDVGYPMPQTGPKTNPTGRGGALGLISSKLATGLARRKQKRTGLQTQQNQPLSQQAIGNRQTREVVSEGQQVERNRLAGAQRQQKQSNPLQRAGMLDYMKRMTQ